MTSSITQIQAEFKRKMEKALSKGDFKLFDNLREQYDRVMNTREQVPAKVITDTMTPDDKAECNRLLRKIPVLADIAEGAGIDLLNLLQKYDPSVTLPMLMLLKQMNHIAKSIRGIVDKVPNEEFAISFGDTSDRINEAIDNIFREEKQ